MNKTKELKRLVEELETLNNDAARFKVYISEEGDVEIDVTQTDKCTSIEEAIVTLNLIICRLKE